MTVLVSTLTGAFAALCVWLTVRIVNRRERWAKWTLAATAAFSLGYPLSVGPAHLIECSVNRPWMWRTTHIAYRPLALMCSGSDIATRAAYAYCEIWGWRRPRLRYGAYLPPGFELESVSL